MAGVGALGSGTGGAKAPSSDPFGEIVSKGLNKSCSNCFKPLSFGLIGELVVTNAGWAPLVSSALAPQMPAPAAKRTAVDRANEWYRIFSFRTYTKSQFPSKLHSPSAQGNFPSLPCLQSLAFRNDIRCQRMAKPCASVDPCFRRHSVGRHY